MIHKQGYAIVELLNCVLDRYTRMPISRARASSINADKTLVKGLPKPGRRTDTTVVAFATLAAWNILHSALASSKWSISTQQR